MLRVKIFRGPSIEDNFNAWSDENPDVSVVTAQYAEGEGWNTLVVFYTARAKDPAELAGKRPKIVVPRMVVEN